MFHKRTKRAGIFLMAVFSLGSAVFGQDDRSTIKAEAWSAFVWGEDSPSGAVSSTIRDPLAGNAIHKLSYAGVELNSRIGFEGISADELGTLLNYTTTVVNSTDRSLLVRYGGITVDGHTVSPLLVVPSDKQANKRTHKNQPPAIELAKMHCFASGFLSKDNFFSSDPSSQTFTVAPQTAVTVSSVIRDPRRYHSVLCSVDGCYPTGTIRYYLNVDNHDYVFVWPGRSAVYCGQ